MTSAARRASRASSSEQQPRAPSRNDAGDGDNARCTAVTSYPASTARAAATAESTPPDRAASTFIDATDPTSLTGGAGAVDHGGQRLDHRVDVSLGRGVAKGEAQRAAGPGLVVPHRQQDVGRAGDTGRARRPRGAFD